MLMIFGAVPDFLESDLCESNSQSKTYHLACALATINAWMDASGNVDDPAMLNRFDLEDLRRLQKEYALFFRNVRNVKALRQTNARTAANAP